jgi:hypothetical protein
MIERFYAKHLPLSADLVRNLQTTGRDDPDDNIIFTEAAILK